MNAQVPAVNQDLSQSDFAGDLSVSARKASQRTSRVITLAALSARIAGLLIVRKLAAALRAETGSPVLLVHLVSSDASISLKTLEKNQPRLNGHFAFSADLREDESGIHMLTVRVSAEPHELAFLDPLFKHFARHFRYVLVHASAEVPMPVVIGCLGQSRSTYLLLGEAADSLYDFSLFHRELRSLSQREFFKIKPVLCVTENEGARSAREALDRLGKPVRSFIHGCPSSAGGGSAEDWSHARFNADIRRLAREIGHCRVGLALSSGGAKGLAHIGVIQVLEENGIDVDIVAGCSMGAYVAAVWAQGHDGRFMEKLARAVEQRWGLLKLVDPVFPPRRGFVQGQAVVRRLKRTIGDAHFSDMVRPLRVVATNLETLERVVFSQGEVATAVHASIAIPGVCVPVPINGELYTDGGIADPLPVDVLQEMRIERIIAVNTIPSPAYMRCCLEAEREQAEQQEKRPFLLRVMNRHLNYFARGNILDIMMRAVHGAQIRVAEESCRHAHLVLRPLAWDAKWHDFTHPGKYIELGRRVAEEHLEEIKALIGRKEPAHENHVAHNAVAAAA